jgi:hypothetical protein
VFSFLLFCAPLFLVFALIVRRSGNYLCLSSFLLDCNLSRIINYDQKGALVFHLLIYKVNVVFFIRTRTKTCPMLLV